MSQQQDEQTPTSMAPVVVQAAPLEELNPDTVVVAVNEEISPANDDERGENASDPSGPAECVICLNEIETGEGAEETSTLICGHAFHAACVAEWLEKDGRCPTCRRQICEVAVPASPSLTALPDGARDRASMQSMAILMLESRRLMMLATMEAALAVRACTYAPTGGPPQGVFPSHHHL